jgi:serine/threonine-protein kinase RsbT
MKMMNNIVRREVIPLLSDEDIVRARKIVRDWTISLKFSLVDQTKLVTAVSELARNTVEHGGGGSALLEILDDNIRRGIRLTFEDQGPGIANIDQAMTDGYSSRGSLGLGLGGTKRLVNEFDLSSEPGKGTRVTIARWK